MYSARDAVLDELDDALTAVRRLLLRPGYKRHFMQALGEEIELGTYRTIRAVSRLKKTEQSIGHVADSLGVDGSTASRLVDRAVDAGYVARRPAPDDRRRTHLELTGKGREIVERATTVRRQLLDDVTKDWETAALAELGDSLQKLRKNLDELEG